MGCVCVKIQSIGVYPCKTSFNSHQLPTLWAHQRSDNVVKGRQVYFKDPSLGGLEMQFALQVDFAPMAIRLAAFRHVGGLDEGMSEPGMCGICECPLGSAVWMKLLPIVLLHKSQTPLPLSRL